MELSEQQRKEIDVARAATGTTRRAIAPALEEVLCEPFPVLDHGFVRVIDYMGNDDAIVQAARVSYGSGTKRRRDDEGLIRYLLRNGHTSPFEMCELKLHVKLPIFVARQWIRHRTANVNEYSARYSILDREFYVPDSTSLGRQSVRNKQSREGSVSPREAEAYKELIESHAQSSYSAYEQLLSGIGDDGHSDSQDTGLARELARVVLPVSFYTQWYWKIDLHNLLHFLRLRVDDHAQFEIREYASVILSIVEKWVPLTHKAFVDYRLKSLTLSEPAIMLARDLIQGVRKSPEDYGLSESEWSDLMTLLGHSDRERGAQANG